jgi:hypothetical protein
VLVSWHFATVAFNVGDVMQVRVLCIVGNDKRWEDWRDQFLTSGHTVVRATDERQAFEVLKSHVVDLICIDSHTVAETWTSEGRLSPDNLHLHPRVPIVLVRTEVGIPAHFEQHVDVVTNEVGLGSSARWLIDDLHEVRFPLFVQWFNRWKQQYEQNKSAPP